MDFIWNYIWDTSDIFYILTSEDIADVIPLFLVVFLFSKRSYLCNKKKITRWLEHMKLSEAALTREIFFPLEDKLHMFGTPCNILYVSLWDINIVRIFQGNA